MAGDPGYVDVLASLRERLDEWMEETDDPLLKGPVEPPPGAQINEPNQRSAGDTVRVVSPDPADVSGSGSACQTPGSLAILRIGSGSWPLTRSAMVTDSRTSRMLAPQRDPDLLEGLRVAQEGELVGRLAVDAPQRAVDLADDLGEGDVLGRPGEPVAALCPGTPPHQPGVTQLREDGVEEPQRNLLVGGDPLGGHRTLLRAAGELDHRPHRVVRLGRDRHRPILA